MCKLLGIHKTQTTAGRPQSDGLAENVNKTLQNMLVCMAEDNLYGLHKLIISTWPWPPGGDVGIGLVRLSIRP